LLKALASMRLSIPCSTFGSRIARNPKALLRSRGHRVPMALRLMPSANLSRPRAAESGADRLARLLCRWQGAAQKSGGMREQQDNVAQGLTVDRLDHLMTFFERYISTSSEAGWRCCTGSCHAPVCSVPASDFIQCSAFLFEHCRSAGGKIGQHASGARSLEREQALHHHRFAVEPALFDRCLHHRVFA